MNNIKKLLTTLCAVISVLGCYAQIKDLDLVREKAESGDPQSQYLMGWYYSTSVQQDYKRAVNWLEKSARQDYEPAQYYLGWCYYYGHGVERNFSQALYWYKKAADQGNEIALSMTKLLEDKQIKPALAPIAIFDPSRPPILEVASNSIRFVDPNGNNAIDANETCFIDMNIENVGKGDAIDCVVKAFTAEPVKGLKFENISLPIIKSGEIKNIQIPISSSLQAENNSINIFIQVDEPHGFGTDPVSMTVNTKKFEEPMLQVVDYAVASENGGSTLEKKKAFDLQILLQNIKSGNAEDVSVSLKVPQHVILMNPEMANENIGNINGGAQKMLVYPLIVANDYSNTQIPIEVNIKERYGKYAENKVINLQLNQALTANRIVIEENQPMQQRSFDIKIASISSDVDKNIPINSVNNDNTFVVAIANESYNKEARVPFAANDGKIFSEYCHKTLGIPQNNIHLIINATLNDMRHEIGWLKEVIEAYQGEAKILFYYAGHGIPDEQQLDAYLLPVDGYGTDIRTGYALKDLYSALGELPSKSITVFLDACFSGTKREGDMLASARGVAIKVNPSTPIGNMVVFSASQGDETAYPNKEEGHGLFTYYLLKKLQETKGEVSLGDLSDYVIEQVRKQSIVINGKSQTPAITPANGLGTSWRVWELK